MFLRIEGVGAAILMGDWGRGGRANAGPFCAVVELPMLGRPVGSVGNLEVDEVAEGGPEFWNVDLDGRSGVPLA